MLWVLKRTISMKWFFWAPKTYANFNGKKIFTILHWNFLFLKGKFSVLVLQEFIKAGTGTRRVNKDTNWHLKIKVLDEMI